MTTARFPDNPRVHGPTARRRVGKPATVSRAGPTYSHLHERESMSPDGLACNSGGIVEMDRSMTSIRNLFDIPEGVAYFKLRRPRPSMRSAQEAINEAAARRTRPRSITMQHWVDDVETRRSLLASLIGVDTDSIALILGCKLLARRRRTQPASGSGLDDSHPGRGFPVGCLQLASIRRRL